MNCDPLSKHVALVHRYDDCSAALLSDRWPRHQTVLTGLVRKLETGQASDSIRTRHSHAAKLLADSMAAVPDMEFRVSPRPERWTKVARDRQRLRRIHSHWGREISVTLRSSGLEFSDFYGGIKDTKAIEEKIACDSRSGATTLDLFDATRFRVVVPGAGELLQIYSALMDRFSVMTVRCRNYYVAPRNGEHDPYRAVHLCIQPDDEEYIEIQLLTERRETIGILDHGFVHKKQIPFVTKSHRRWLQYISWTANIMDAE